MPFLIHHAILHIISGEGACYSKQELDVESETCHEFIQKHVRRLIRNPGAREATFNADSEAYTLVKAYQKGEMYFQDFSVQLCSRLDSIMQRGPEIPRGDILVTAFADRGDEYLAVLKLNYSECFTHRVVSDSGSIENQIVKNTVVLPFSGGKIEEACLIPYDPMILRILEKPYPVEEQETHYFSELFLQCTTELSKKETAEIIHEIAGEITQQYYSDDVEIAAKVSNAILQEAERSDDDEDTLRLENVARQVFAENEQVQAEFLGKAKEAGLPHDIRMDKPFVRQQFRIQRFKADNGIELKLPAELFEDPGSVRFTQNSDGTVSITLNNLRKC